MKETIQNRSQTEERTADLIDLHTFRIEKNIIGNVISFLTKSVIRRHAIPASDPRVRFPPLIPPWLGI